MRAFLEQYGTSIFVLVLVALLITLGPVVAKEVNGRLYNEIKDLPKATSVEADEDDPSLVHNGTIPEGGVYTAASGTVYNVGDSFPSTVEDGDIYEFGDLKYTLCKPGYNTWEECKAAIMESSGFSTEEEWQAFLSEAGITEATFKYRVIEAEIWHPQTFEELKEILMQAGGITTESEWQKWLSDEQNMTEEQYKEYCKNENLYGTPVLPAFSVSAKNKNLKEAKILRTINDCAVTEIKSTAFSQCEDLVSVNIPRSITTIGNFAFYECTSLTSINIPNGVSAIEEYAFKDCTNLKSVNIPNGLTTIEEYTFYNTGISSIVIPNSVTKICRSAFAYCTNLKSINIPKGVNDLASSAFSSGILSSITVDSDNTVYDSRNNCNAIIETSKNKLILGCKNTVIPSSITIIGSSAFSKCTFLTSIIIPDSVTKIDSSAFNSCKNLKSINLPDGVTYIGDSAFEYCTNLKSITIPNSVTDIKGGIFGDCPILESITYTGTKSQWNSLVEGSYWYSSTSIIRITRTVHCTDGDIVIPAKE